MNTENYPRVFIIAAFLVALVAGIWTILLLYSPIIQPILTVAPPFIIALILAFLLAPVIDKLEKKGISRGIGVSIVGLAFLIVFVLVALLLVPKAVDQAKDLAANYPDYVKQAESSVNSFLHRSEPILRKLRLPTNAREWVSRFSDQLATAGGKGASLAAFALGSAFSRISWLVIIPLATLWLLKDFDHLSAKIARLTPERHRERFTFICSEVGSVFVRYFRGMIIVAMLFSIVVTITLIACGLHYGLIIGVLSGLLYIVPYVGLAAIIIFTVLAALLQPMGIAMALVLAGALIAINSVFDMVITPRIAGGSVGVHPVLSLFALALGAQLFGVIGMIAAVPVAASVQVIIGQLYPQVKEDDKQERKGKNKESN